jgi:hypothetical protein
MLWPQRSLTGCSASVFFANKVWLQGVIASVTGDSLNPALFSTSEQKQLVAGFVENGEKHKFVKRLWRKKKETKKTKSCRQRGTEK